MDIKFKNKLKQCPDSCIFLKATISQLYDPLLDSWTLAVGCETRPCKGYETIEIEVVD